MRNDRAIIVIPARHASIRFPGSIFLDLRKGSDLVIYALSFAIAGKLLVPILGLPVIVRTMLRYSWNPAVNLISRCDNYIHISSN